MIFLITGATHTGKTLLAQKMLEHYRIPYISMDHVKMGLIRTGLINTRADDSDEKLTDAVWPVIREIIKTAVENKQNLIVEGCYVPAGWKHDFAPEYIKEVNFICIVMTEQYIINHFDIIKKHSGAIERRGEDTDFDSCMALSENKRYLTMFSNCNDGLIYINNGYICDLEDRFPHIFSACE